MRRERQSVLRVCALCTTVAATACAGDSKGADLVAPALELRAKPTGEHGAELDGFALQATIAIPSDPARNPGDQLDAIDVGWWEPSARQFYLSDRSNASIDVIDTRSNRFLYRIGGFAGNADHDRSGPNGVVATASGRELWVADGDSTVKVIDLAARKIVDTVSTGGGARTDELSYDPQDQILLVVNNEEETTDDPESGPFATLISTKPDHAVLGKIVFHEASAGLEQSVWDPKTRRFYLSVPVLGSDPAAGGVVAIDPHAAKVTATYPVPECFGAGLAIGPSGHLLVGCSGDALEAGFAPKSVILSVSDGRIVASIPDVGGSDEVWFNPGDDRYYLAARDFPSGPVLGVIDAQDNRWLGNLPTAKDAKSVVADRFNNHVFVALTPTTAAFANDSARGLSCTRGCVGVYGTSVKARHPRGREHH